MLEYEAAQRHSAARPWVPRQENPAGYADNQPKLLHTRSEMHDKVSMSCANGLRLCPSICFFSL